MRNILVIIICSLLLGMLSSCYKEEKPNLSVWNQIELNTQLTIFRDLFASNKLDRVLEDSSDITVFVPRNSALNKFAEFFGLKSYDELPSEKLWIDSILYDHIVFRSYLSATFTVGTILFSDSLQKIEVRVSNFEGIEIGNKGTASAKIVSRDIKATNGIIHEIDNVLINDWLYSKFESELNLLTLPINTAISLSKFAQTLASADYFAKLNGLQTISAKINVLSNQFTVLAPTDNVFENNGIKVSDFTGEEWYNFIQNHILVGNYGSGIDQIPFINEEPIVTISGIILKLEEGTNEVNFISNDVLKNDVQVVNENFGFGKNGTIHLVNSFVIQN